MRRILGLILAALLAAGVIGAIALSVAGRQAPASGQLVLVKGVIGSEKVAFFQDPAVVDVFRRHGLQVVVDAAGSRQIATSIDLRNYDFAFPAGVPAAEKIRRDRKVNASYSPFYTPMAIATFQPIVKLLQAAGVAKLETGGYYTLDMKAYMDLVAKNTRWSDLPNNTAYPAGKSILITSTDVRKSNSAAMYLSIASYVANGNNIVQDDAQGKAVLATVAPLFLKQGYTESSSEAPFDDYLSIGIGKTPMVMIYEAQFIAKAALKDGSITPQMVMMYPSPTVESKHTIVPLTPDGDRAGQLLLHDPELLRLAVKYGFRTSDTAYFNQFTSSHGVSLPSQLVNVIDPPTFEALETMIVGIDNRFKGVS
jgi:hypothetical protein